MDTDRFWELVDVLGGTADDVTLPRLEAELRGGEAEPFLDEVYDLVAALLERCSLPATHAGDTGEWIAAAVVAAGRETYERTRAAGGPIDPTDWAWGEAEALLVAGVEEHDEDVHGADDERAEEFGADQLEVKLGLTFQWCATDPPDGVDTSFDPAADGGDDPGQPTVWSSDDEWTATLAVLDGDPEFHRRRTSLAAVGLHLVVRAVDEATLMAWPSDEDVRDVVLTVPVDVVMAAPTRHDAYVEAVVTLVTAVGEALGTAP